MCSLPGINCNILLLGTALLPQATIGMYHFDNVVRQSCMQNPLRLCISPCFTTTSYAGVALFDPLTLDRMASRQCYL